MLARNARVVHPHGASAGNRGNRASGWCCDPARHGDRVAEREDVADRSDRPLCVRVADRVRDSLSRRSSTVPPPSNTLFAKCGAGWRPVHHRRARRRSGSHAYLDKTAAHHAAAPATPWVTPEQRSRRPGSAGRASDGQCSRTTTRLISGVTSRQPFGPRVETVVRSRPRTTCSPTGGHLVDVTGDGNLVDVVGQQSQLSE